MAKTENLANEGSPEDSLKNSNKIKEIEKLEKGKTDKESKQKDFTGKLRGKSVTLKDVKTKNILYKKRNTKELKKLRKDFNSTIRKNFLKHLAKNPEFLKKAGFSKKDILKLQNGRVPKGWQVHHKLPLDDGGTNDFENLVLIKNEPYHKVITNFQNSFAKQLEIGETKSVNWPMINGCIYPKKS